MSALGDLIRHYLDTHPSARKKDVANAAGVSAQSVSGWLNGTKTPNLKPENIVGLAAVLAVPARDVVLAISADRGIPVQSIDGGELPPEVRVTVATMRTLSKDSLRMVGQLAASLAEQEASKKRPRRRRP